tara:strand:+ start:531 stop:1376 length:846 start_codon:yes stop_codon:yes gene_type:complete
MKFSTIKSHAKINLSLNVVGKKSSLHKIETIVTFIELHDKIMIKDTKSNKHQILFTGKFSNKIGKKNTISKLLKILDDKKLLNDRKFIIQIDKRIPYKSGLGGGSMNAASILKYFVKKKIVRIDRNEIIKISNLVGSDTILGIDFKNSILTSNNSIKYFKKCQKIYTLIVKPNFGCSTKYIYSKVKKFNSPVIKKPNQSMFNLRFLKKLGNSLEHIALNKYSRLKTIKKSLENLSNPEFVRMTGSGSALVAYFQSKSRCENAKKMFNKKYKNYWCITSKTI